MYVGARGTCALGLQPSFSNPPPPRFTLRTIPSLHTLLARPSFRTLSSTVLSSTVYRVNRIGSSIEIFGACTLPYHACKIYNRPLRYRDAYVPSTRTHPQRRHTPLWYPRSEYTKMCIRLL